MFFAQYKTITIELGLKGQIQMLQFLNIRCQSNIQPLRQILFLIIAPSIIYKGSIFFNISSFKDTIIIEWG